MRSESGISFITDLIYNLSLIFALENPITISTFLTSLTGIPFMGTVKPSGGWESEVGGAEEGYPADASSTLSRKTISSVTRNFFQNLDHFAWTNKYSQMRRQDFFGEGGGGDAMSI